MELADGIQTMHDSCNDSVNDSVGLPAADRSLLDLSIGSLADVVGGQLSLGTMPPLGGEAEPIGRIVTDSRQVQPGDLFWALPGKTVNGAHFAEEAILRGAQGTVVAGRDIEPWGGRFSVRVPDSQQALIRLGQWTRRQFEGNVIAVAGGPGKTTTCAIIDQLLRASLQGTCDSGLRSDATAAALTMLQWPPQNDYAILEMTGGDEVQFAEISALCDPQIVVITSPRKTTHHKSVGDLAAFAKNLVRLLDSVPSDAIVVMHGDEPWLRSAARKHSAQILWVGRGSDCDVVATNVSYRDGQLTLDVDDRRFLFPVWGRHNLVAALAAVTIGKLLSVSPIDMQAAARSVRLPDSRCNVTSISGITLIDDTYNATLESMNVALELLSETSTQGKRLIVCGDLDVDHEQAPQQHGQLGHRIVTWSGADVLICCGDHARVTADAAIQAGMPRRSVEVCQSEHEVTDKLTSSLQIADVLLVSGKRSAAMQQMVRQVPARSGRAAA